MSKDVDRVLFLMLSDPHYGSDIEGERTGKRNYGAVEEARATAEVCRQAAGFKHDHRESTTLYVAILGDLIAGKLHDKQAGADYSDQISRASWVLGQGIDYLAGCFPDVRVGCVTGNHGRWIDRHPGRAADSKTDSVETVIYRELRNRAPENVRYSIPRSPFLISNILGHRVLLNHGDTSMRISNPGKALNIAKIEATVNRWSLAHGLPDIVAIGHHHRATVCKLDSGCTLLVSGSLRGTDEFAVASDFPMTSRNQTMMEITKRHSTGDIRIVHVNEDTDRDKTLDRIIKPWS